MKDGKKPYDSPKLILHGDIEEITQGMSTGQQLDATFTVGTFRGSLTFS